MATSWHKAIKSIFSNPNRTAFRIVITVFPQSKNDKDNLKRKTLTRHKTNVLYLATNSGTRQRCPREICAGAEDEASSQAGLWRAPSTSLGKGEGDVTSFAFEREANPLLSPFIICYTIIAMQTLRC